MNRPAIVAPTRTAFGATGVRIPITMLHDLRRRGGSLALKAMCIGGGQGAAAVFRGVAR